jgi:hypothetical protein
MAIAQIHTSIMQRLSYAQMRGGFVRNSDRNFADQYNQVG